MTCVGDGGLEVGGVISFLKGLFPALPVQSDEGRGSRSRAGTKCPGKGKRTVGVALK